MEFRKLVIDILRAMHTLLCGDLGWKRSTRVPFGGGVAGGDGVGLGEVFKAWSASIPATDHNVRCRNPFMRREQPFSTAIRCDCIIDSNRKTTMIGA